MIGRFGHRTKSNASGINEIERFEQINLESAEKNEWLSRLRRSKSKKFFKFKNSKKFFKLLSIFQNMFQFFKSVLEISFGSGLPPIRYKGPKIFQFCNSFTFLSNFSELFKGPQGLFKGPQGLFKGPEGLFIGPKRLFKGPKIFFSRILIKMRAWNYSKVQKYFSLEFSKNQEKNFKVSRLFLNLFGTVIISYC